MQKSEIDVALLQRWYKNNDINDGSTLTVYEILRSWSKGN